MQPEPMRSRIVKTETRIIEPHNPPYAARNLCEELLKIQRAHQGVVDLQQELEPFMFLGQLLLTGIFGRTGFEVVVMVQPIILRRRAARRHSDEIQSFGNESRLKDRKSTRLNSSHL